MSAGGNAAASGARARRPRLVGALVAWLAALPWLQAASLAGLRIGNAAPDRPWSYAAYWLAAPYVAWLVWRRHPRARFAAYVFLTHEALRGFHLRRWDAVAIAGAWVLLLQLPAARRWMPAIRPAELRARWRRGRDVAPARPDGRGARRPALPGGGDAEGAPRRTGRPPAGPAP